MVIRVYFRDQRKASFTTTDQAPHCIAAGTPVCEKVNTRVSVLQPRSLESTQRQLRKDHECGSIVCQSARLID